MRGMVLMCLLLLLAACAGGSREREVVTPTGSGSSVATPVAASPVRQKIVQAALEEWHYFGQQLLTYPDGEESIPHVGYWEDEFPYAARVGQYWLVAGRMELDGMDCSQPWSAAFISYIMQSAGVREADFPASEAHWRYLQHIVQHSADDGARFLPHDVRDYLPEAGDLICATRGEMAAPVALHPEDADALVHHKLHCDIVIRRDGSTLDAIGGNVRNSVSLSRLPLDRSGHLKPLPRRPWFLVIENRL